MVQHDCMITLGGWYIGLRGFVSGVEILWAVARDVVYVFAIATLRVKR
jgi:hypothetical protein